MRVKSLLINGFHLQCYFLRTLFIIIFFSPFPENSLFIILFSLLVFVRVFFCHECASAGLTQQQCYLFIELLLTIFEIIMDSRKFSSASLAIFLAFLLTILPTFWGIT